MSTFWTTIVSLVIFLNIIGCYFLIRWVAKPNKGEAEHGEVTGHVWDDNLAELNNPMPRWWLWLFYITIVAAFLYIALYPSIPSYAGLLNWTSTGQYNEEIKQADKKYGPIFSQFSKMSIDELSKDESAQKVGQRLFITYCAQCHGSDAGGSRGFPNLTDNDWLWGGKTSDIEATILHGRNAVMMAWGPVLKKEQIEYVTEYVLSLSDRKHKATDAERGKTIFESYCVACHTSTGTGNQLLGAANLTDNVWLYGGSRKKIIETITHGRNGIMPAHANFLGKDKVHVLAAYVYSLSNK